MIDALERRRCACQGCEYFRPRVEKLVEKLAGKAAKRERARQKGAKASGAR